MVGVAQLVELWLVAPVAGGSSPLAHPIFFFSQEVDVCNMLPSYNHNVSYAGHTFHIQTEDSGPSRQTLVTHLFLAGDIIATARTQYVLDDAAEPTAVVTQMQKQHQDVMRALIAGRHDAALTARGITLSPAPGR